MKHDETLTIANVEHYFHCAYLRYALYVHLLATSMSGISCRFVGCDMYASTKFMEVECPLHCLILILGYFSIHMTHVDMFARLSNFDRKVFLAKVYSVENSRAS